MEDCEWAGIAFIDVMNTPFGRGEDERAAAMVVRDWAAKGLGAVLVALALVSSNAATAQTPAAGLKNEIHGADTTFFRLMFEVCDPDAMSKMLAPDFEMYHDRGGFVAKSAPDFLIFYGKDCKSWTKPGAVRARRVLVPDSLSVYPVPGVWHHRRRLS